MRYLPLLTLLLLFACGTSSADDAPAPPEQLGLETVPDEQPVVEAREIEDYNPDGDERALDDLIVVENVVAEQGISSPFTVRGRARGYWFFEGDFPVILTDADGTELAIGFGHPEGEWMTDEFVSFTATLNFKVPSGTRAILELMHNNPGAPDEGFERSMLIPLVIN